MKIICLEEHFTTPALVDAWSARSLHFGRGPLGAKLADISEGRIAEMDRAGVDVQVLALTGPGLEPLPPSLAVDLARDANDQAAAAVAKRPDRLGAFISLPTPDPGAAATELRRGVDELGLRAGFMFGRVGDRNVDHPDFDPLWAAAEELGTPIYIHPAVPPQAVNDAYYGDLGDRAGELMFAMGGLGWHYETGVQLLRMIYGRVFDRFPSLQVIVGHWGEVVLFYSERLSLMDAVMNPKLDRPTMNYLRENVYYTPSGMFSARYMSWALDLVGVDRLMFSTDYPYIPTPHEGAARTYLNTCPTLDSHDRDKIAHGNWERLTMGVRTTQNVVPR